MFTVLSHCMLGLRRMIAPATRSDSQRLAPRLGRNARRNLQAGLFGLLRRAFSRNGFRRPNIGLVRGSGEVRFEREGELEEGTAASVFSPVLRAYLPAVRLHYALADEESETRPPLRPRSELREQHLKHVWVDSGSIICDLYDGLSFASFDRDHDLALARELYCVVQEV